MTRLLLLLALLLAAPVTAFAAEDGLRKFLAHIGEPWALFFVIGTALTAIPLIVLLAVMVRGLFNRDRFYPQRKGE